MAIEDQKSVGIAARLQMLMNRSPVKQAFAGVRREKGPFMLLFPLMPIILHMKNALMAESAPIMGVSPLFIMAIAFSVGIGLMFWPARRHTVIRYAHSIAYATALLFALWIVLPIGTAASIVGLLFSLCMGGCAAYALYGFTYALSDTERFFGALLTALASAISQTVLSLPGLSEHGGLVFLGIQVVGTVLCLTRYRSFDNGQEQPQTADNRMLLGIVLFFFFAQRAVMFFHSYLQHAAPNPLVGLAGLILCGLTALIYAAFRFHVWHLCNLFFVGMLCVYGLRLLMPGSLLASDILQATGLPGFVASYYLLGYAFKRTASFTGFKKLLAAQYPQYVPAAGAVTVTVLLLAFVMTTPFFAKVMFVKEQPSWETLRARHMEQRGLTPREQEIALLLLKGKLLKECAADLDISTDTVKYHTKNIYRKLGINGRSELTGALEQKTEDD